METATPFAVSLCQQTTDALETLKALLSCPIRCIVCPPPPVRWKPGCGFVVAGKPPLPDVNAREYAARLSDTLATAQKTLQWAKLFFCPKYQSWSWCGWGDFPDTIQLPSLPSDLDQAFVPTTRELKRLAREVRVKQQRLCDALQLVEKYQPTETFICCEANLRHPRTTLRYLAAEPSPLVAKKGRVANGIIWEFQPREEAA